jgi:hypothetical protein
LEKGKLTVYPGTLSEYQTAKTEDQKEIKYSKEEKIRLELRLAQLEGELSGLDRERNQEEYQALEAEYFQTVGLLREVNNE